MTPFTVDTAILGMAGAAATAVIAAAVKAFAVASTVGGMLERNRTAEASIALIPGISHKLDTLEANMGVLATRQRETQEEVRAHHSEMHELRTRLEVEVAVREHSQGAFGQ